VEDFQLEEVEEHWLGSEVYSHESQYSTVRSNHLLVRPTNIMFTSSSCILIAGKLSEQPSSLFTSLPAGMTFVFGAFPSRCWPSLTLFTQLFLTQ